jgi:hypothetical protein
MVYGFGHQGRDGVFLIKKYNSRILAHDQTPQPLTLHNRNKHITFDNKK